MSFYLEEIKPYDPVLVHYLDKEQQEDLSKTIEITLYLLQEQLKKDIQNSQYENSATYDGYIEHCKELKQVLTGHPPKRRKNKPPAKTCSEFAPHHTKSLIEVMNIINEKRLYWVWTSALLKTIIGNLPSHFFNTESAKQTLRLPDTHTGRMSWILYYLRFSFHFGLFLAHVIPNPWMSEEEKKLGWKKRAADQWAKSKFSILNDGIWATGNLLCTILAMTVGDLITTGLLLMDVTLAVWDYREQKDAYEKNLRELDEAALIEFALQYSKTENIDLCHYQRLRKAIVQCKKERYYQHLILTSNVIYAVALILAFVLLATPMIHLSAANLFHINLTGALLCFAFSWINDCVKGAIMLSQTGNEIKELKKEMAMSKLNQCTFFALATQIDLKEQQRSLQKALLIHQMGYKALIPALIFATLMFFPVTTGIELIVTAIVVTIALNILINKLYKPEEKTYNQKNYQFFSKKYGFNTLPAPTPPDSGFDDSLSIASP